MAKPTDVCKISPYAFTNYIHLKIETKVKPLHNNTVTGKVVEKYITYQH